MNKHVVILGAGLSGLSAAWFAKQRGLSVTLLEKAPRAGGWIRTIEREGFLFEQGPHSCRPYGESAASTLRLIEGLGLQGEVIAAHPHAKQRYLYTQQRLQRLPRNAWGMMTSPLMRGALSAGWRDLSAHKIKEDESVATFMRRHIGESWTARFFDPLTSGIYAGDMEQLSMAACFPTLFQWGTHGSLIKGACLAPRAKDAQTPFAKRICKSGIFSFIKGMETLTLALERVLGASIQHSQEVAALHFDRDGVDVQLATGEQMRADHVISALPARALADLFHSSHPLHTLFTSIPTASVVGVNLGYRRNLLKYQGFGHLVPRQEQEEILGAIWDSSIFPEQDRDENVTRLTVMMGGTHQDWQCSLSPQQQVDIALRAVAKQLQIDAQPDTICLTVARDAIPQYRVGHLHLLRQIAAYCATLSPYFSWIGSSFHGVSLNDCVYQAEHHITQIAK